MSDRAVEYRNESDRKRDLRRQKIAGIKHAIYIKAHAGFWRTLHAFGIARIYSVIMCKANLYRKYPDGRCHWCGDNH